VRQKRKKGFWVYGELMSQYKDRAECIIKIVNVSDIYTIFF
jgi:hypothetical protein